MEFLNSYVSIINTVSKLTVLISIFSIFWG